MGSARSLRPNSGVADSRSLIRRRQKCGTPVFRAAVRERRLDGNETRQVLILTSQTVEHPRPHAGPREGIRTRCAVGAKRRHAPRYRRPRIGPRTYRQCTSRRSGNRSLTSTPLCPYGRNSQGDFMSPPIFPSANVSGRLNGSGLPSYSVQRGLRIERVDARWAAMHKEKDHAFRPRRKMRCARRERVRRFGGRKLREQTGQPERAETAAGLAQRCAP